MKLAMSLVLVCTSLALFAVEAQAFGSKRPSLCFPSGGWKVVDTFIPSPTSTDQSGQPYSAASTSKASFVIGSYFDRETPFGYRWIVRRSLDRGETWATSEVFSIFEEQDTEATGVAADMITDEVYVVGKTLWQYESFPTRGWIVRKSSDQGATWSTVDSFISTGGVGVPYVRAVAVAAGVIYVVGVNDRTLDELPDEVLLRRSEDGGATWTTTNLTAHLSDVVSVAATGDGAVFISGKAQATNTDPGNWVVAHSPNGKDSWAVVDRYSDGSAITGSAAAQVSGRVAVFGTGESGKRWIVREALASSPTKWTTIDSYRPEVIDGKGWAVPGAATFSKAGPLFTGNLFVAGDEKNPLKSLPAYTVRRRLNPTAKTFVVSDQYEETYSQGGPSSAWGSTTTAAGDILVAHAHPNPSGRSTWTVRKLTCKVPRTGN